MYAEKGKDIEIQVPCGVTAIREDGNVYLGEINEPKERLLLVKGANGGCKRHDAEKGEKFMVYLDLKLIADVGLIGYEIIEEFWSLNYSFVSILVINLAFQMLENRLY